MATLKLSVLPKKELRNGTHKVRIAISHKQDTRYIGTNVIIDSISQFRDGQIVGRHDAGAINKKLRNHLNKYQDVLDTIDPDVFTCSELCNYLKRNTKIKMDLFSKSADDYIAETIKDGREKTAELYGYTKKYFIEKFGDIPLQSITTDMLQEFEKYLHRDKGFNSTYINMHQTRLKAIINDAVIASIKYSYACQCSISVNIAIHGNLRRVHSSDEINFS